MGTNRIATYDASIELRDGLVYIDNQYSGWEALLAGYCSQQTDVVPSYVAETNKSAQIPEGITLAVMRSGMWNEYDTRCINCGRCNFVCPTCTCFTMQDIFYTDNGKVGERRRVWASCMVDGFTDVAGGEVYRQRNGQRQRFKVLHKVYDYKQRHGYQMCVGCGRCDDICPEYISFAHCINKLHIAITKVANDGEK